MSGPILDRYRKHRRAWMNCLEEASICRVEQRILERSGLRVLAAIEGRMARVWDWVADRHRGLMVAARDARAE